MGGADIRSNLSVVLLLSSYPKPVMNRTKKQTKKKKHDKSKSTGASPKALRKTLVFLILVI